MDFIDGIQDRKFAVLLYDDGIQLADQFRNRGWDICEIDSYLDGLDLWAPEDGDAVEMMFSSWPADDGIRRHLPNYQDLNVGMAGKCLTSEALRDRIADKYLRYGYTPCFYGGGKEMQMYFIPTKPANEVQIKWQILPNLKIVPENSITT